MLYWKKPTSNRVSVDRPAGWTQDGYVTVGVNGTQYRAHRIIYKMFYGHCPITLDHKDRNRSNNRIENIRECSNAENLRNSSIGRNNTTGCTGVSFDKDRQIWYSRMMFDGKRINLGRYKDRGQAIKARKEAEVKYLGEFAPQ